MTKKTPKQIEKEMNAEIKTLQDAIKERVGKLNKLKRSFHRLDDKARASIENRLERVANKITDCWSDYMEINYQILNPPKPKRRRRRRTRHGSTPSGYPLDYGAAGFVAGLMQPLISRMLSVPVNSADIEWPHELDAEEKGN